MGTPLFPNPLGVLCESTDPRPTINGTVTDQSGEPLEGAELGWNDSAGVQVAGTKSMTTKEDGKFRLERPDDGVTVRIRHENYLPIWLTNEEGMNTLQPILYDDPMTIVLRGRPRLEGIVHGEDGRPAEPPGEVKLELLDLDGDEADWVKTDIQYGGRYLFENLPEGSIELIRARAKGFDELELEGDWPLIAETSTMLDLELPSGITVVGTVRDSETKLPVPFAEVWTSGFQYEAESNMPTDIADADGRFRLEGVTPSDMENMPEKFQLVWIAGNSPDHNPTPFNPSYCRQVEPGVYEVELELIPSSCSLKIVVYEPGREKVAVGVHVWTIDSQKNFNHATTNRHGEIELDSLPPGEFRFAGYRPERNAEGIYTSVILDLDLAAGSHGRHEVELLGDERTSITGVATEPNGTPVPGVEVKATYTLHFNSLMLTVDSDKTVTDEFGRYSFRGLRAGRHKISTNRGGLPEEKSLELEWGGEAQVDFLMGSGMDISGTVELGDEKFHHVRVHLYQRNSGERLAEDMPNADGAFEFKDLPAAEYDLVLVKDEERLDAVPVGSAGSDSVVLRVQ